MTQAIIPAFLAEEQKISAKECKRMYTKTYSYLG